MFKPLNKTIVAPQIATTKRLTFNFMVPDELTYLFSEVADKLFFYFSCNTTCYSPPLADKLRSVKMSCNKEPFKLEVNYYEGCYGVILKTNPEQTPATYLEFNIEFLNQFAALLRGESPIFSPDLTDIHKLILCLPTWLANHFKFTNFTPKMQLLLTDCKEEGRTDKYRDIQRREESWEGRFKEFRVCALREVKNLDLLFDCIAWNAQARKTMLEEGQPILEQVLTPPRQFSHN